MMLVVSLAAIAFVLAILGVYGVLSYSVRERTQEIGVRMALGADAGRVARLTRFLQTLLFGVKPIDPLTFGVVALVLLLAGAAASYLPASRAARLDPAAALRHE